MRSLIKNWLPVLLWAALIFSFSSDSFSSSNTSQIFGPLIHWLMPGISPVREASIHAAIRKLGHWSEYFVLAILLMRGLGGQAHKAWNLRLILLALTLIFVYACSDEFHQLFVSSRTASFRDSLLDFFGGGCGVFWTYWSHARTRPHEPLECR